MHCSGGTELFRVIIIVCLNLCRNPVGADITVFICRHILLKPVPPISGQINISLWPPQFCSGSGAQDVCTRVCCERTLRGFEALSGRSLVTHSALSERALLRFKDF